MFENLKSVELTGIKWYNNNDGEFFDIDLNLILNGLRLDITNSIYGIETGMNLPEGRIIPVDIIEQNDSQLFTIANQMFLVSKIQGERAKKFYEKFNAEVQEYLDSKQKEIYDICDKLSGVDEISSDLLNLIDKDILLNHDAVILFHHIHSFDKHDSIKLYDINIVDNTNFLEFLVPLNSR